ncbi:hypothetical protein P7K49_039646, partial [Saguinus oedipus]
MPSKAWSQGLWGCRDPLPPRAEPPLPVLLVKGVHVSAPVHQAALPLCSVTLDSRPVDLPQVHVLDSVSRAHVDMVNGVLDHLDPVDLKAKELHGGDFSDPQQPAPGWGSSRSPCHHPCTTDPAPNPGSNPQS